MSTIDLPTFERLTRDLGADFVRELVETYCLETPQLIAQLPRALAGQDAAAFRRAAHSIKSTSNTLGALQLGTLARELEALGREGNLAGVHGQVDQLAAEYDRVQQALKDLTHG